jgi:hypothetical protein
MERVRDRERSEPDAQRAQWTKLRGRLHAALAARGSRIALYDLRESLEAATAPLPLEFLAALSTAGDASCLEAIAAAYARSNTDAWWRNRLVDVFNAIVKREQLTRRHAVAKKIQRRWGSVIDDLWATRTA